MRWALSGRLQLLGELRALESQGHCNAREVALHTLDQCGCEQVDSKELGSMWQQMLTQITKVHSVLPALRQMEEVSGLIQHCGAPKWAYKLRYEVCSSLDCDNVLPINWRRLWALKCFEHSTLPGLEELEQDFRDWTAQRAELVKEQTVAVRELVVLSTQLGLYRNLSDAKKSSLMRFLQLVQRIGKVCFSRSSPIVTSQSLCSPVRSLFLLSFSQCVSHSLAVCVSSSRHVSFSACIHHCVSLCLTVCFTGDWRACCSAPKGCSCADAAMLQRPAGMGDALMARV